MLSFCFTNYQLLCSIVFQSIARVILKTNERKVYLWFLLHVRIMCTVMRSAFINTAVLQAGLHSSKAELCFRQDLCSCIYVLMFESQAKRNKRFISRLSKKKKKKALDCNRFNRDRRAGVFCLVSSVKALNFTLCITSP